MAIDTDGATCPSCGRYMSSKNTYCSSKCWLDAHGLKATESVIQNMGHAVKVENLY